MKNYVSMTIVVCYVVALVQLVLAFLVGNLQASLLMLTVALTFGGFATYTLIKNYKEFKSFVPCNHRVYVQLNGYRATREQINADLDRLVDLYSLHFSRDSVVNALEEDDTWVVFHPGAIQQGNSFFAGQTVIASRFSTVAFFVPITHEPNPDQPISRTAFVHELGHILLANFLGTWDESVHHKFMADKKLP